MTQAVKSTNQEHINNPDTLQTYYHPLPFVLESGESLPELRITYHTFGKLNAKADNIVWVTHALTANSDPTQWWPGLVGDNELVNPEDHFIICANILGSCYGTTGPRDFNPENGERYLTNFPDFTIRDIVRAHELLRRHLGIEKIYLGLGGSMGGQQLMEWAIESPELFENLCILATGAQSTPWGIAFRAAQRMAMEADPSFFSSSPNGGKKGAEAARAMAMISYRTREAFNSSQQDDNETKDNFRADSYQRYQGLKLSQRFDARTYYILSKAMDTHNVGRGRGSVAKALSLVKARTLVLGIQGDLLFANEEQEHLASHIPGAQLEIIPSHYGHDGFLIEAPAISKSLDQFLKQ
ncbi:MAG: homoserine O-acetyltransferase [Roseivirga sp.]|nr:homoserine O-acetyltransferase [Roseivirga sp.]